MLIVNMLETLTQASAQSAPSDTRRLLMSSSRWAAFLKCPGRPWPARPQRTTAQHSMELVLYWQKETSGSTASMTIAQLATLEVRWR